MTMSAEHNTDAMRKKMAIRWRDYKMATHVEGYQWTIEDVKDAFMVALIAAYGTEATPAMWNALAEVIATPEHEI